MEVSVERGGVSIIILGIIIGNDGDGETINFNDYVVTCELTIPKVTANMVE